MSSNFGQMGPLTMELAALEHLKNWCLHVFSVAIDLILFKLSESDFDHNPEVQEKKAKLRQLKLVLEMWVISLYSSFAVCDLFRKCRQSCQVGWAREGLGVIWTASSQFGTYSLCEQRRFRRACASAQSRQNLRCSLIQAVSQEEPSDRKPDP